MHSAPPEDDFSRPFSGKSDERSKDPEKERKQICCTKSNRSQFLRIHTAHPAGERMLVTTPSLQQDQENLFRPNFNDAARACASGCVVRNDECSFRNLERSGAHHEGNSMQKETFHATTFLSDGDRFASHGFGFSFDARLCGDPRHGHGPRDRGRGLERHRRGGRSDRQEAEARGARKARHSGRRRQPSPKGRSGLARATRRSTASRGTFRGP